MENNKMVQRKFNCNDKKEIWYTCPKCYNDIPWVFEDGKPISLWKECKYCGQSLES